MTDKRSEVGLIRGFITEEEGGARATTDHRRRGGGPRGAPLDLIIFRFSRPSLSLSRPAHNSSAQLWINMSRRNEELSRTGETWARSFYIARRDVATSDVYITSSPPLILIDFEVTSRWARTKNLETRGTVYYNSSSNSSPSSRWSMMDHRDPWFLIFVNDAQVTRRGGHCWEEEGGGDDLIKHGRYKAAEFSPRY